MRALLYGSTVCYLIKDNKVLFLKFHNKHNQLYCPPGGKIEINETPTECVIREFKEETGLTLINPKLKIINYYSDIEQGLVFVYVATKFEGELILNSIEGKLEWIKINDINKLNQFEMNEAFYPYLFKDGLFEGKYYLDDDVKIIDYKIIKI